MSTFSGLFILGVWLALIIGWIINLVEVINMAVASVSVTTMFVIKVVGIFVAPLGSVLGLFF